MTDSPLPAFTPTLAPERASLRVSAESAYPLSAPGPRVRIASFAPFLRPFGVDLQYRPTLTDGEYATIASSAPALVKARVIARAAVRLALRSQADGGLTLIHRLRFLVPHPMDLRHAADVYDIDDALFVGSTSAVNQRHAWIKREAARSIAYMRHARLVLAGNSFIADAARSYARRVEVIPSCVDPSRHEMRQHRETDVLTVGWVGSPSTSGYLAEVLPVFERLNARKTRFRLVLVGADRALCAPWLEHRSWSLSAERQALAEYDVGIMPLTDDAWARGKCGYKRLLYFAAGLPTVASPVGVNPQMVAPDRGLLAASSREWETALTFLASEARIRAELGAAARTFVEREFSYRRWAPDLADLLRSVSTS